MWVVDQWPRSQAGTALQGPQASTGRATRRACSSQRSSTAARLTNTAVRVRWRAGAASMPAIGQRGLSGGGGATAEQALALAAEGACNSEI